MASTTDEAEAAAERLEAALERIAAARLPPVKLAEARARISDERAVSSLFD